MYERRTFSGSPRSSGSTSNCTVGTRSLKTSYQSARSGPCGTQQRPRSPTCDLRRIFVPLLPGSRHPLPSGPAGSARGYPAGPASGSGRRGGGVVVDGADERLGCGLERLGAAGGAAEDRRALERRDGQVGEGRGAVGGDAQRFEAGDQRRPPPGEHAVEVGAGCLVAGGQLEDHGGDGAAALVARAFEAAGEDLGHRPDERGGVIGVAGGVLDPLPPPPAPPPAWFSGGGFFFPRGGGRGV